MSGTDLALIFKPSLFSLNSTDRKIEFFSDTLVVHNAAEAPLTPTGMLGYSILTSDNRNGRVFYTNLSRDQYEIHCWDVNGSLLFSFSLGIPPVAKTSQELQEEIEYEKIQFAALGMNNLPENYEPDPFHTLIVGLGVDNSGNLWIQRGTEEKPVFDIINNDGVHIGTAEFPRNGHHWKFSITPYGSLAWNLDPESGVQRVYTLELPVLE